LLTGATNCSAETVKQFLSDRSKALVTHTLPVSYFERIKECRNSGSRNRSSSSLRETVVVKNSSPSLPSPFTKSSRLSASTPTSAQTEKANEASSEALSGPQESEAAESLAESEKLLWKCLESLVDTFGAVYINFLSSGVGISMVDVVG
jgi:hypothetical protein